MTSDSSRIRFFVVYSSHFLSVGSENRRNKLQGIMSDFPPKPTPPPSIPGQARSGEGEISVLCLNAQLYPSQASWIIKYH